jgi:hypothetical protein
MGHADFHSLRNALVSGYTHEHYLLHIDGLGFGELHVEGHIVIVEAKAIRSGSLAARDLPLSQ